MSTVERGLSLFLPGRPLSLLLPREILLPNLRALALAQG
ncbi:hypothetical protein AJ79_04303 [Helicocarpus griseus UAMH5409]|uniref:Uncharacterized protein n=1 Tax=Helicocarpus griseus UAMH5409 TaxID=1447875 RepID=A0A2B7XTE2_9EURO|nr:hypothetical protein AJ79_04303 [Helicocarpus griseus UAMH5409]